MKILLAIDGSSHSQAALDEVASRKWPEGTAVEVLTVIHTRWPVVGDPVFLVASAHAESLHQEERVARRARGGARD